MIYTDLKHSIDPTTDATMQRVIKECFQNQTIVMIAHRLKSMPDFDRLIVLNSGRVVEVGAPGDLLDDELSSFRALYSMIED